MSDYLIALLPFVSSIAIIYYSGTKLSHNYGSDIRVVCYLFSLSLVVTSEIAWWAVSNGAIDKQGTFNGVAGQYLDTLLSFMFNLTEEIIIFVAIVVLIVLPQILSYFLSGLFGCASTPVLIQGSFRFLVWSLVKLFAVTPGVLLPIAIIGLYKNWDHWGWRGVSASVFLTAMLIMFSFFVLTLYRDPEGVIADVKNKMPSFIRKMLISTHAWLTRSEKCDMVASDTEVMQ